MNMLASHVYYFDIGRGRWVGDFSFRVTSWRRLRRASIGVSNLFLVVSMDAILRIFGQAKLESTVTGDPDQGSAGVANNVVKITKLGVPLYLLDERYDLDPNGTDVTVASQERFGPIPFLFNVTKECSARIKSGGRGATYQIPLLGDDWVADYSVRSDNDHIHAVLQCPWSSAEEVIDRAD
jgi:hypothetical protein